MFKPSTCPGNRNRYNATQVVSGELHPGDQESEFGMNCHMPNKPAQGLHADELAACSQMGHACVAFVEHQDLVSVANQNAGRSSPRP